MKLAEALQERGDLNRLIQQMQQRLRNNAVVQEGEAPAEDPEELLAALDGALERLEELMARINRTNCATVVEGKSLTEHLAQRDCLTLKVRSYQELAESAAASLGRRATRSEIKLLSTVDIRALQRQIDGLSKELRLLDNLIQQANWSVELQ